MSPSTHFSEQGREGDGFRGACRQCERRRRKHYRTTPSACAAKRPRQRKLLADGLSVVAQDMMVPVTVILLPLGTVEGLIPSVM